MDGGCSDGAKTFKKTSLNTEGELLKNRQGTDLCGATEDKARGLEMKSESLNDRGSEGCVVLSKGAVVGRGCGVYGL